MGRGPKDIHTHVIGDLVIVRLRGVLTVWDQRIAMSIYAKRSSRIDRANLLPTASRSAIASAILRPAACWYAVKPRDELTSGVSMLLRRGAAQEHVRLPRPPDRASRKHRGPSPRRRGRHWLNHALHRGGFPDLGSRSKFFPLLGTCSRVALNFQAEGRLLWGTRGDPMGRIVRCDGDPKCVVGRGRIASACPTDFGRARGSGLP
jgi:hypothetical protein